MIISKIKIVAIIIVLILTMSKSLSNNLNIDNSINNQIEKNDHQDIKMENPIINNKVTEIPLNSNEESSQIPYKQSTSSNISNDVNIPKQNNILSTIPENIQPTESKVLNTDYITLPTELQLNVITNRLIELINNERSMISLNQLLPNKTITKAAVIRSTESNKYGHKRPNGSSFATIFNQVGYPDYKTFKSAENIGTFSKSKYKSTTEELIKTADILFNAWKKSELHYNNIINPIYNEVGIGSTVKLTKDESGKDIIIIEVVNLFSELIYN